MSEMYSLQKSGGEPSDTSSDDSALSWYVFRAADMTRPRIIAEGAGRTEAEAEKNLRDELSKLGWSEKQIEHLVKNKG